MGFLGCGQRCLHNIVAKLIGAFSRCQTERQNPSELPLRSRKTRRESPKFARQDIGRVRERPPCCRESRYLRHQGRCLGDNRQASLSGHEGGSRHAWRRGAAWSAPRPWAAPDCEGCRGPVQDGGSSWTVPVYHFRCDVGRGDLPESNPAPRAPMEPSSPREGSAQERLAQGVRAFRD